MKSNYRPNNWNLKTLEDISCSEYGLVDGPFGSNLPASCYVPNGVPVIRGSNLSLGEVFFKGENFVFISEETAKRLERSICKPEDIIFTKKGTLGQTGFVPKNHRYNKFLLSSNQMKLSVDKRIAEPKFVYYYVSSPSSREKIIRDSEATGVPKTNLAYLKSFPILLPPLDEQKAIAYILGTLDDKIELNQQMNRTLEGIARAIFKSWFIDFDPVRAKMDGRQPAGMDAETAALFPDEFEDSPLGQMPKGWTISQLEDFIDIKHGYAFKGEYFRNEPHKNILLTPGNFAIGGGFKDDKLKYYDGPVPEEFILGEGDLLVTMTDLSKASDTLGYPAIIPNNDLYRYLHNQRLGKVILKSQSLNKLYLYFLMRTDEYRNEVLASSSGTTVKHTSPTKIKAFKFICPSLKLLKLFESKAVALQGRCDANAQESLILSKLRDTILPKLLSGEICIENIETCVEDAA